MSDKRYTLGAVTNLGAQVMEGGFPIARVYEEERGRRIVDLLNRDEERAGYESRLADHPAHRKGA